MKHIVCALLLLLGGYGAVEAQVTIGRFEVPEQAAILDIKGHGIDTQNSITGTGGILLPRVALLDVHTLQPFVSLADPQWTDANQKQALMQEHMGLEVYNLTENAVFEPGAYVWDGTKWDKLFKELVPIVPIRIVFPLPAFDLPLVGENGSKTLTFDLYNVYSNNMRMNNFISNMEYDDKLALVLAHRYNVTDLDFVVTHYDKSVMTIHGISDKGILSYTVHNINPNNTSFMNIYAVVKKGHEKN